METEDVGAYTWELATSNQDVFAVRNGLSMEPGLRNDCVELEETVAERAPSFQRLLGYVHTCALRRYRSPYRLSKRPSWSLAPLIRRQDHSLQHLTLVVGIVRLAGDQRQPVDGPLQRPVGEDVGQRVATLICS